MMCGSNERTERSWTRTIWRESPPCSHADRLRRPRFRRATAIFCGPGRSPRTSARLADRWHLGDIFSDGVDEKRAFDAHRELDSSSVDVEISHSGRGLDYSV